MTLVGAVSFGVMNHCVARIAIVCFLFGLLLATSDGAAAADKSCRAPEPWGWSEYRLAGSTILHYVQTEAGVLQLARKMEVGHEVTLCVAIEKALVFLAPDAGVFQIDRGLDAAVEVIRLAKIPEHFSQITEFQWKSPTLSLVTGSHRTEIAVDIAVLNDALPLVYPAQEVELEVPAGAPFQAEAGAVRIPAGHTYYDFALSEFVPVAPPEVRLVNGFLQLGEMPALEFTPGLGGHCQGLGQVFVYDATGLIRRLNIEDEGREIHETGRFRLSAGPTHCLVDETLQRLYVTNDTSVMWVFDLNVSGLDSPRGVTSDLIVETVAGLATYGASFVITQSTGDGSFLVFSAENMRVVGQFKVMADVSRGLDGIFSSLGFAASARASTEYPRGVLLVQDELNRLPDSEPNLKLIDWRSIEEVIE